MHTSPLIQELVEAFRCLPGVGPKSAQRMSLHLLERSREGGHKLAAALQEALINVGNCEQCRTLTEEPLCRICANPQRNRKQLCIVESPADIFAIESSAAFKGIYFVLMGHLSPIDGIGPEQLAIPKLIEWVEANDLDEVIVACNPTVEGDATAYYLAEQLNTSQSGSLILSRIAHGVPIGGELEYVDGGTLSHALSGRTQMRSR